MNDDTATRAKLGQNLVLLSTIALVILAVIMIIGATVSEFHDGSKGALKDTASGLITSLLPLFGTWVGTVLAFYFTKENYEAASRATLDVVKTVSERLSTAAVVDNMIDFEPMIKAVLTAEQKLSDLGIADLEKLFNTKAPNGQPITRLPILDASHACVAILHRSALNEMLAKGLREDPPLKPAEDKLEKLLSKPYPSKVGATFGDFIQKTAAFVDEGRSVADAKAAMERLPQCQDVMVTRSGKASEPVRGWITNITITRLSSA